MATQAPEPSKQALTAAKAAFMAPREVFRSIVGPGWEWSVTFQGNEHKPYVWAQEAHAQAHMENIKRLDPEGSAKGLYSLQGPAVRLCPTCKQPI